MYIFYDIKHHCDCSIRVRRNKFRPLSSQIYIHFNSYCGIGDLLQCVLQKAGNWRFNAFTLETVTGGKQLKYEIMKKEKLRGE